MAASLLYVPARLLADEGRSWQTPASPVQYLNVHFLETADGRYFPRYPQGVPVAIAAVRKLAGADAALALNLLLASLLVFAVYLLAEPLVAPLAALAVAVHPAASYRFEKSPGEG
jgi:4-amino-4-deoxy-L-arabinose transferase-like glycosyltransferase